MWIWCELIMSATLYHQTVIHHIYLYQGWKLNIGCHVTLYPLPSFENGPHFGARGPWNYGLRPQENWGNKN
ncbi:hypothetical protein WN944_017649 [Citrus x changshan-huyou]|uniref:Uncharacterized protein n=1 Tax=Citrus x changshan-huyou TaxID=2935761 RepID=A0AAP0MDA5_9ROSI